MARRLAALLAALALTAGCVQDAATPSPADQTASNSGDTQAGETLPGSTEEDPDDESGLTLPSDDSISDAKDTPMETHSLYSSEVTRFSDPFDTVIREPGAWREVWEDIVSGQEPQPPVPEVDFERDMVVLVAIGERPSGGYTVEISSVSHQDDVTRVVAVELIPGRECAVTRAVTSPVAAVTVPRTHGEVMFIHETEPYTCSDSDQP